MASLYEFSESFQMSKPIPIDNRGVVETFNDIC